MSDLVCPRCGSNEIFEHTVDLGDDDEEFECLTCGVVGSEIFFTPSEENKEPRPE